MAEEFDVEAMLEAPYLKEDEHRSRDGESRRKDKDKRRRSRSKERKRSRSKERKRSRSKERKRSRSRSRDKKSSRNRDRDHSERDKGRERDDKEYGRGRDDRDGDRRRRDDDKDGERRRRDDDRTRDRRGDERRERNGGHHGGGRHRSASKSPVRKPAEPELTVEEKDARTVFCMQLAARIRANDIKEFFSSVGKVRDVRMITDNKTGRSKGIAYVEFEGLESVPLALGLSGQRLLGVPIIVQASQAEKNRLAMASAAAQQAFGLGKAFGPMKLFVGSLHYNITEDMLRGIFEPFGRLGDVKLNKDPLGNSQGYGFVTFLNGEDARKALDQLNGFEIAGRPMKVNQMTERWGEYGGGLSFDEHDRASFDLGATGRLQLMAKLAEGTGLELPAPAQAALLNASQQQQQQQQPVVAPPIATQCFMLSNMFDPTTEQSGRWEAEVSDDVIEECNKHGGVLHIFVDKASPQGNVYVKCVSIAAAVASVTALHGRFFSGRIITAAYVPLPNYTQLFPDSQHSTQLLTTSAQQQLYEPF